jgi:CBS domain-containing protein
MARAPDDVGGVMTRGVVTVAPSDVVQTALRAMLDHDIGAVVVVDGDRPVGMFTERDVTRRVLDDAELLARPVSDVMAAPVVTIPATTDVVAAFELLNSRGIRRLPVVEDGRVVGIVTERDLLRWVGRVAKE